MKYYENHQYNNRKIGRLFRCLCADVWGDSIAGVILAEVRKAVRDSIELVKKYNSPESIPQIFKDEYLVEYQLDGDS